jgi:ABC-2 type transport system permease protein
VSRYEPPAFASAAWLVASREIRMRLRSKVFLISTGILMVAVLASVVVAGLVGSHGTSLPTVAAVGNAQQIAKNTNALDVTDVDSVAQATQLLKSGAVEAALIPSATPAGLTVIAKDSAPDAVIAALSVTPSITLLDPPTTNALLAYFVALAFGLIFFMSAITFGQTIAQSVVEEKQTRVVEILISTVPVRVLLAGKIIGNSILAFAQIVAIAALAAVGSLATGQTILLGDVGPSIIWFVVFFAVGFVMLAALYSAAAALVSRQEDLASAVSPITLLVVAPYILVITLHSNPVVLGIMSYIPFSAPVGMPMRIFLGDTQWWEPILSLVILFATMVGIVILGSRIYANGLLRTGARVSLKEALVSR